MNIDAMLTGVMHMWTDHALQDLSDQEEYSRSELSKVKKKKKPGLTDSAFRWTLYNLQQEQKLFRIDYDTYTRTKPKVLPEYRPLYSAKAKEVSDRLSHRFPELNFMVFESVLLNEFLNHQIAQNTIYIQVDKDISSFVFDSLQEDFSGSILYKPDKKEFDRYWTKDCIVVLDLISQAPLNLEAPHEISAEKLLVDIVAEKSIAATFSPSELPFVFENIINSYRIDMRKLNRYAGRRGKAALVRKLAGVEK